MTIKKYYQKRNFNITSEPKDASRTSKSSHPVFVVQKHAASRLHYDFRLELRGVLKSWAVPKGPSYNPAVKRLAVEVEDHPLEYANFEGVIPKGQYGGGAVMVWDKGYWISDGDAEKFYKKGDLTLILQGEKLKGRWKLIRIQSNKKNKNTWLLFKMDDEYANSKLQIISTEPRSTLTNRTIEEIASNQPRQPLNLDPLSLIKEEGNLKGSLKKSSMPCHPKVQLAYLVEKPPGGEDWLHEIKFDGYRILGIKNNDKISLLTRNGMDWTEKIASVANVLHGYPYKKFILDGELVALDKQGKSNFQQLQNAIKENLKISLRYYVFDILFLDGYDLTKIPLLRRKEILKNILTDNLSPTGLILYSDHAIGSGEEVYTDACKRALEGIVSKNIHSLYEPRRSKTWLKVKCQHRQEFVIVGYTKPEGKRQYFGSLLLAIYNLKKQLIYCGHVGTGFSNESLEDIFMELQKNQTSKCYLDIKPSASIIKSTLWVKPKLVCEVTFSEWTTDGILRHPSFKGLRFDKDANTIIKESSLDKLKENNDKYILENKSKKLVQRFGISITHPDKVMPGIHVSKEKLIDYYDKIQKYILPHIVNRPLSTVRCTKNCFYQKHFQKGLSKFIYPISFKEDVKKDYIMIKNISGLLSLIQADVVEIHPWGSKVDNVEKPDRIIFDLDPDPDLKWSIIIDAAFKVYAGLKEIGLEGFVKTSGGKGLHIVIPIIRKHEWLIIKEFSKQFSKEMSRRDPSLFTASASKVNRKGKIFLDYIRNSREATIISAYSVRSKPNGPISMPVDWEDLNRIKSSDQFNIDNVWDHLNGLKQDPWADFLVRRQALKNSYI